MKNKTGKDTQGEIPKTISIDRRKTPEEELQFRIDFKNDFGIDYLEACDRLRKMHVKSERNWRNTLIKYGVIK